MVSRFRFKKPIKFTYTRNLEVVNYFINHPTLRNQIESDLEKERALDANVLIGDKNYHIFVFDRGILLFYSDDGRIYESEIYFLPEKRGLYAYRAAETAIRFMFDQVGASKLVAAVAETNKASERFARFLRYKEFGREENSWQKNGKLYSKRFFVRER